MIYAAMIPVTNDTAINLGVVVAAGAIGSATLLPMKFVRRWPWQNLWLLYAIHAYLLFPLLTAWLTVPQLSQVYGSADWWTLIRVALFGFGWGLSVVMLGLAVAAVGLAVSTGIILGCSVALGSLIPLLLLDSAALFTVAGAKIAFADFIVLIGVVLCARAGYLRDRRSADFENRGSVRGGGLLLCFVAGVLTPLLNLALTAGAPIAALAVEHGAAPHQATNAVWGLAVGTGSLPSILYCLLLLQTKKTWPDFKLPGSARNAILCVLMATFFIVSTIGYGIGAVNMGPLGPVVGWPVYISSILLGNSFWGWCTSEWRDAPRNSIATMVGGIGLQILGILLLFMVDLNR